MTRNLGTTSVRIVCKVVAEIIKKGEFSDTRKRGCFRDVDNVSLRIFFVALKPRYDTVVIKR